jgi:hypothetical protein
MIFCEGRKHVVSSGGFEGMKLISINSRRFLGYYIDIQNRRKLPDLFLWSGILLFVVLLTIFCLTGGVLPLITIVCVLVLGSALGVILKQYFPYRVLSCLSGFIWLTPSTSRTVTKAA